MLKKLIIVLLVIITLTIPVYASFKRQSIDNHYPDSSFAIWTDEKYGIEYIVCEWGNGVGICPRYDKDGSLVHVPVNQ